MKSVEFCYWLQGMFELSEPKQLDEKQTDLIKRHLAMVFTHEIDPSYPANQLSKLNELHAGSPSVDENGCFKQTADPHVLFRC